MVSMLDAETGMARLIDTSSKKFDSIWKYYRRKVYFKETFNKSGSGLLYQSWRKLYDIARELFQIEILD
jgi:hypothetical protein